MLHFEVKVMQIVFFYANHCLNIKKNLGAKYYSVPPINVQMYKESFYSMLTVSYLSFKFTKFVRKASNAIFVTHKKTQKSASHSYDRFEPTFLA